MEKEKKEDLPSRFTGDRLWERSDALKASPLELAGAASRTWLVGAGRGPLPSSASKTSHSAGLQKGIPSCSCFQPLRPAALETCKGHKVSRAILLLRVAMALN